jgi:hypothetical protein
MTNVSFAPSTGRSSNVAFDPFRERDATMKPAPQDIQLMSKQSVLSFKPQLRLEWQAQDGQSETEKPDHSANLGDSITASTRRA